MFDLYRKSEEYIYTHAEELKNAIRENPVSTWQRLKGIPRFFGLGLKHMWNIKIILPLALLKVMFVVSLLAATVATGYLFIEVIEGKQLAVKWATQIPGEFTPTQVKITLYVLGFLSLWGALLALIPLFLGLFNGAIGAATYLYAEKEKPTLGRSLHLALQHVPTIWKFRLIHKLLSMKTSTGQKEGALARKRKEALHLAWNVGTVGMRPAILNGRTLDEATKRSFQFAMHSPREVVSLVLVRHTIMGLKFFLLSVCGLGVFLKIEGAEVALGILVFITLMVHPIYLSNLYMQYERFLEAKQLPVNLYKKSEPMGLVLGLITIYTVVTGGIAGLSYWGLS